MIVKTREYRETRVGKNDCKNWRIQRNEEGCQEKTGNEGVKAKIVQPENTGNEGMKANIVQLENTWNEGV